MIRTSLSLVVGVAALAISAEAGACSFIPGNRAYQPVMAEFVRNAPSIYLARAVHADWRPDFDGSFTRPTHIYHFEVLEVLNGEERQSFDLLGFQPWSPELPEECRQQTIQSLDGYANSCSLALRDLRNYFSHHAEADQGRLLWDDFYYVHPVDHSGMDVPEYIASGEIIVGNCFSHEPGFEIGETFLVATDGTIQPLEDWAFLNSQLIARTDDAWLSAVRFFIDHPERDFLPERSLRETLIPFGPPVIVRAESCAGGEGYSQFIVDLSGLVSIPAWIADLPAELTYEQRENGGSEHVRHCRSGGAFLLFEQALRWNRDGAYSFLPLFPIREGMVDFTDLATQWEISDPLQAPIHDVISWLSDTEEAVE